MALTVSKIFSVFGDKAVVQADIAFDSSYAYGGEALNSDQVLGLHAIESALFESKGGYTFEYDKTNEKLKVFPQQTVPPIVFEEKHTIASNAITLDYPAAYIMAITQADSTVKLTTSGATLAAGEAKPTAIFAAGVKSAISFHSGLSGVVNVTYITQAWKDVWDNLVQEEAVTIVVATEVGTLANQAIAIQAINVTGTTSTNCCLMLDKDDTAATTECVVDMTSTAKTLTFAVADVTTSAVVTYVKKPASGFLFNRFVAEESLGIAANVATPAYPILIWGYCNQIPENGADTEAFISLAGSAGADEAKLDLMQANTRIVGASLSAATGMYVWGRPWEIVPTPLEVATGTDLSALTSVKGVFIGS